ncbi:MAG: alpha-hydroxy-acid oxidizing protein [Actinobacteria bacterium]|nr:alpha-hydroxy-acid oxidizing protein [Actinomycetota bacterium]
MGEDASVSDPITIADFEALAEAKVPPETWCYFAGGAGDEVTLRANVAAFRRWRFRPRMLTNVAEVSTATEVLGIPLALPVLAAPTALQRLLDPEGELATARACAAAGTLMCVSTLTGYRHSEIAAAAPGAPRWQQIYVLADRARTEAALDEAADCGYSAVVLTVDTPYWLWRERDTRVGFRAPDDLPLPYVGNPYAPIAADLSWRDVDWLASRSRRPVIVKGVLTREDTLLAVEHGAAGVIVSNHGGRQLDGVAATLDVLPEVAEAVAGRVPVLVDGGVRRGVDVLKALALGAQAVLVGRPLLYGLAADGEAGVARVLEILREEVWRGLVLLGCRRPDEVTRAHVEPTVPYDSPA